MKKILNLFLVVVLLMTTFAFTGCNEEESTPPEQTPITCEIKFAKTVDEKYQAIEWYEGDEFEINTKIYVIVDFTLINYGAEDDWIEFKIQIPYAKYYSTHEYKKGVVAPKEEYKDVMNDDGTIEPMVELSNMVFRVKPGQIPFSYTYCFSIEANQVCEGVNFTAKFIPNKGEIKTVSKAYSFVQNVGGEE